MYNIAYSWLVESYQNREDEWNRTWAEVFDPVDDRSVVLEDPTSVAPAF